MGALRLYARRCAPWPWRRLSRLVTVALGNITRAKGMTEIARKTGLGRESLYKALSTEGNPEMATFLKVVRALGIHHHATATA